MKPITAPMKLGQTGAEVSNLQEILLLFINDGTINIENSGTLINQLADERSKELLGSATSDLVKRFRAANGINSSSGDEIVNSATLDAINHRLNELNPPTFSVSGSVTHVSGKPMQGEYMAAIYLLTYNGKIELGSVPVHDNGTYEYQMIINNTTQPINIAEKNGVHVEIQQSIPGGVTTVPVPMQVIAMKEEYGTGDRIVVNITVEGNENVIAEYAEVYASLQAAIGAGIPISSIDLTEPSTLTVLANKTGEQEQTIRTMITAHKLHSQLTGIDTELLYGLLRQNLPDTVQSLATQKADIFYNALKVAAGNHIISVMSETALSNAATTIETAVNNYILSTVHNQDAEESGMYRVIEYVAEIYGYESSSILKGYKAYAATPGLTLEDALGSAGVGEEVVTRLQQGIRLMVLMGNNAVLVLRALAILRGVINAGEPQLNGAGENADPSLLANVTRDAWQAIISNRMNDSGFFFPDFISDEDASDKVATYAAFLEKQFDLAYPTQAIIKAIAADDATPFVELKNSLSSFMQANPLFDLRTVPVAQLSTSEAFHFEGVANKEAFIQEAGIAQRLMSVTQNQQLVATLATDNLHSALQISRLSSDIFVDNYQTVAGSAQAATAVYEAATSRTAFTFAGLLDQFINATGKTVYVLDQTPYDPNNTFAEWRTLFGSLDGCNCSHCQSVYSPAAYLTDLLEFLKNNMRKTYDVLLERRPDIKDIELVCKNINTPVPHIDIVNELLEDLVSAVANSLDNNNNYVNSSYKMYARQTGADAATQRAIPEHINTYPDNPDGGMPLNEWSGGSNHTVHVKSPYPALKKAVYPASLPYNFYKRQIDLHLGMNGVKPHEIMQRFSALDAIEGWNDQSVCAAYLGISEEERNIIIGTAPDSLNPYPYYGLKLNINAQPNNLNYIQNPALRGQLYPAGQPFEAEGLAPNATYPRRDWVDQLAFRVDVFLQQTGLTYPELQTVLDCYFINPKINDSVNAARKIAIVNNDPAQTTITCDLSKMQLLGMDKATMKKFYRFIRLKKALNWTYYELDKTMISLSGINPLNMGSAAGQITLNGSMFVKLVQTDRLAKLLRLSITEVGLFWKEIDDTLVYTNYDKSEPEAIPTLYQQLFRNPLTGNINDEKYPFPVKASGLSIPVTVAPFPEEESLHNYLSGIFNIASAELSLLIKDLYPLGLYDTGSTLSLTKISTLYRQVLLLKSLKLSVSEWLQYRNWIMNGSSFNAASSADSTYEVFANAFGSPYQAIRFTYFVNLVKEAGVTIAETGSLLLDTFTDSVAEGKQSEYLVKTLTALRTELKKKTATVYQADNDEDGAVLKELVQTLLSADQADHLVKIIQNDPSISAEDPITRIAFLQNLTGISLNDNSSDITTILPYPSPVLESDSEVVAAAKLAAIKNAQATGRLVVYNAFKKQFEETTRRPFIINFFAKEFKVDEEIIRKLIQDCIEVVVSSSPTVQKMSVMDLLLMPDFIGNDVSINRWNNNAKQFAALTRLQKAIWLISRFGLDLQDVIALWEKQPLIARIFSLSALPVATAAGGSLVPVTGQTAAVPFYQWIAFLRWIKVKEFLGKRTVQLYNAIRQIPDPSPSSNRKEPVLTGIASAFNITVEELEELVGSKTDVSTAKLGALKVTFDVRVDVPNSYNVSKLYLRIMDCLEMQYLLPSPMSALIKIADAVNVPDSQQKANEIIQVVKAQYDDSQWLEAIRPVNDQLRTERRDAMVSYLLANPPHKYYNYWRTSNDLFETLMLDVDMMTCMSTTRVLLAVNTVQLWVDRILLGLEKYVDSNNTYQTLTLDKPEARQWRMWRKLYRVWEANRKVFLYPENWIEPELRDDKSPFFKELEKFLKQNELTDANVEDAYQTYLERLEEVAHLDVVAMYREVNEEIQKDYKSFTYADDVTKRDIIHVFGRTPAQPHIYYYRKRVADEWTPWEKMDVQIDGDHFVPVMWRGKLRFYWLVFMKDQIEETAAKIRSQDEFVTPPATRWKIQLAWTEYKNGKWTAKQMSKDSLYTYAHLEEDPQSTRHIYYYSTTKWNEDRLWSYKGALEKQRKNNIRFYAKVDGENNLQFVLTEKVEAMSTGWMNSQFGGLNDYLGQKFNERLIEVKKVQHNGWLNDVGFFTAKFQGIIATQMGDGHPAIEERNIYTDYSWLAENGLYEYALQYHNYNPEYTQYRYNYPSSQGYRHYPDDISNTLQLLGKAPDTDSGKLTGKYLVFPRQTPVDYQQETLIRMPYFFYKDTGNSFFVEKVMVVPDRAIYKPLFPTKTEKTFAFDEPTGSGGSTPLDVTFSITKVPKYRFHNFNHDQVDNFRNRLYTKGLEGLLDYDFINNKLVNTLNFSGDYAPTENVWKGDQSQYYPHNKVDFSFESATALYNWELFFHIPLLIANKLMQDQKFEEARKWYHFIFNPSVGGTTSVANFWNFPVFHENATNVPTPLQLMSDTSLGNAVARWANDPFKPHLVARTRVSAYMKNTVMKYLDNLIAWGDMLFRTDTRENINEATLMYVLAAQLLGRKPVQITAKAQPIAKTYASLTATATGWNAFSNGMIKAENYILSTGAGSVSLPSGAASGLSSLLTGSMYYFCLPSNDQLSAYWDTIGDRLFKIRHCQNIDGIERELALFDPPIDPALLVKAAAAGLSLSEALADINAPLPLYRFNVMSQKATELVQEVKGLGSQMLSALEKKDAEMLSLLRSSQEQTMLGLVTEIKEQQLAESVSQINGLQQQQKMTTQRRDYYKRLMDDGLNAQEQLQLDSLMASIPLHIAQGATTSLAAILHLIPNLMLGPLSFGAQYGGDNLGKGISTGADIVGIAANVNATIGQMASIKGGYKRRKEDWEQQLKTAEVELKQIDIQILGAQIRKAMAELELRNHQTQMQNAQEMDNAMRNKYTNEDLYDWMVGEISITYFQAYKLAMDVAKRAERCYRHELGIDNTSFIQPAYWDSLKKGLLAGEQLMYDIKRMEVSYLEKNKRHLELTKHISLAQLAPDKLFDLKKNQSCTVTLPEWLFDLDYPGQHLRRIKSVSVSIPCVAGPYTTVSCKLSLVSSKYRINGTMNGVADYDAESQYKQLYGSIQSIATSSAQNDSGMFEFSFRDERYLPFEGAGAISTWKIELPAAYAQFDYNSISDIILHVNYTALDEGGLRVKAKDYVQDTLSALNDASDGFLRGFSMKQEFSNEWYAYHNAFASAKKAFEIKLSEPLFPYFCKGKSILIDQLTVKLVPKEKLEGSYSLKVTYNDDGVVTTVPLMLDGLTAVNLQIDGNIKIMKLVMTQKVNGVDKKVDMTELLDDLYVIAHCACTTPGSGDDFPGDDDKEWEANELSDSMTSKMQAWWKADAGITTNANGAITSWTDQSGNNNNLTPVAGTEPTVGTSDLSNIKPVAFNGNAALYTGAFQDTASFTANVLIKVNNTGTGYTGIIGRNTASQTNGWQFWLCNSQFVPIVFDRGGSTYSLDDQLASNAPDLGNWELLTIRRDAVNNVFTWWKNGVKLNDYPCGPTALLSNNAISMGSLGVGNHYGYFDMLETIIYDEALTDTEIADIHGYFKTKYNLSLLPSTQPMAWWKADAGITKSPSGAITLWADQSGNGNGLTALAGTEPRIGTNRLNNVNPVAFNGNAALYTGNIQDTQNLTATILIKTNATSTTGILGRNTPYDNTGWALWIYNNKYTPSNYGPGVVDYEHSPAYEDVSISPDGDWELITYRRDAANGLFTIWKNGVKLSDYPCNHSFFLSNIPISMGSLGTVDPYYGYFDMLETILYDEALSDEEIADMHGYFKTKYSSPQAPAIQALAWWKADAPDNDVVGNQLNVWKDQSGNGNDIAAPDPTKRPAIISNWKNGKPALAFNGAQALRKSLLSLPANTEDVTVFMVGEKTAANLGCVFELSDNINGNTGLAFATNDNNIDVASIHAGSGYDLHGVPSAENAFAPAKSVYCISYNMSDGTPETSVDLNGIKYQLDSTNAPQTDHISTFFESQPFNIGSRAGNTLFASFNLAEMIILPYKATETERTNIKAYLKTKYNLPSLPISNPTAWYKADSGVVANNGVVSSWHDSSTHRDIATVLSATAPSLIMDDQGVPAVSFGDNIMAGTVFPFNPAGNCTIFSVSSSVVATGLDYQAAGGWSTAFFPNAQYYFGICLIEQGAIGYSLSQPTPPGNQPGIMAVTVSQEQANTHVAGYNKAGMLVSEDTIANKIMRGCPVGVIFGGYQHMNATRPGLVYEAIFYDRILSNEERSSVLAYLSAKYSHL